MSKKLRGSLSVYKETKTYKDFVWWEMFIIASLIGYFFKSWFVWLIALFISMGSLGTKLGLLIGWIVTVIWTALVMLYLHSIWHDYEITLVFGFLAGTLSWYAHDCGNLYYRDFIQAEWW